MTDAELVSSLQANDDAAYREVVARYGDALYGYVHRITGDHHLSEDIVSETYLRMVERIDGYTLRGPPFKAWLYRIAHNLTINALKARRHCAWYGALEHVPAPDDPARQVVAREELCDIGAALTHLTTEQQQVLALRFDADQSLAEIALILDKTENAVKQMQFRALRSLARFLTEPETPPTTSLQ